MTEEGGYTAQGTEEEVNATLGNYTVVFKGGAKHVMKNVVFQKFTSTKKPDKVVFARKIMGAAVNLKPDGSSGFVIDEIAGLFRHEA